MRRRWAATGATVAATAGLLLSACGSARVATGSPPPSSSQPTTGTAPSPTRAADPLSLVGMWRVSGAAAEGAGTFLKLGDQLAVWKDCGVLMGDWRADRSGLFVADVSSWTGHCAVGGHNPASAWLASASGYATGSAGIDLLDAAGKVVAHLARDGRPSPHPDVLDSEADPPTVTPDLRKRLSPASPLPSPGSLTPAARPQLIGTWLPDQAQSLAPSDRPTRPYLTTRADQSWTGSDGCNGSGGRWLSGPDGEVLATAGVSTLIGCPGVAVDSWWENTARAGFADARLVLFDADGHELGSLHRAG
jgi:hypothetical protein